MRLDGFDSIGEVRNFVQAHRAKDLLICDRDIVRAEREGARADGGRYDPRIDSRERSSNGSIMPNVRDVSVDYKQSQILVPVEAGYDVIPINAAGMGRLVPAKPVDKNDYEAMSGQD